MKLNKAASVRLPGKNTWFTSDHHFGHKNILAYCERPFSSVEQMNNVMLERWNALVQPEDDVYYLGDFALDFKFVEHYLPRLQGTIYWIPGNHDAIHPMYARSAGAAGSNNQDKYEKCENWLINRGVICCPPEHELFLDGIDLLLCHFPYGMEDHTEKPRYLEWRPLDTGLPLLCGHMHDIWRTNGNMINVGVDQWDFYPVSGAQVLALVENSN